MKNEIKSQVVTTLLNGTLLAIQSVIPIKFETKKPQVLTKGCHLTYGVLTGITGDIRGNLVLTGEPTIFSQIAEKMFGSHLEGEMLISFSGELGNMIAGGLSTNISKNGNNVNITTPTIMQGDTTLSGYLHAIEVPLDFQDIGTMNTYLLID